MKHHSSYRGKTKKTVLSAAERKKRIILCSAAALLVLSLAGGVFYLTRPKVLWYVDADLAANWNRVIDQGKPPLSRHQVLPITDGSFPYEFPKGRYGYIISRRGPEGESRGSRRLYSGLSRAREYSGWQALALDPGMIFRKHQDPEPDRTYIDSPKAPRSPGGLLLLPGAEEEAVNAWLSQLLQENPGSFVDDEAILERTASLLPQSRNFQDGAPAYTWVQTWPILFREETAWLYAPISRTRTLDPYRMGLLDATRFPEPSGWNRYGLQAEILWANRRGSGQQLKKLASIDKWLSSPQTQALIANTIEWIPAHPESLPYNTIFSETQIAWIRSSFIWQPASAE
jgi:hypothetical protein